MNDALAMLDNGTLATSSGNGLQDSGGITPYVAFAHPNNKQWAKITQTLGDVPEGTPLLFKGGKIERLDNMSFWLTPAYMQHFSVIDNSNKVLQAKLETQSGKEWKEHVESVILVMSKDGVTPARLTFRTTKCPAARDMVNEIADAATEGWAQKNPDNAAAASSIGQAWLRVQGTIQLTKKPNYVQANARTKATSAGMWAAIQKAISSDEFKQQLQECIDEHNKRVAEIQSKVK